MLAGLAERVSGLRKNRLSRGMKHHLMGLVDDTAEVTETLQREVLQRVSAEAVLDVDIDVDYSELSEQLLTLTLEGWPGADEDVCEQVRLVTEELFHFVHPELEDDEAWRIHRAVKRLVKTQGIQEICIYLKKKATADKLFLPQNPSLAYKELVRMGMPNGEGYTIKNFQKYYNR